MENKDENTLIAERKAKQDFLNEEIVDMNYSPELFLEFCENQKSSNIDEWDINELYACVKDFKAKHRPGETYEEVLQARAMKKEQESDKINAENPEILDNIDEKSEEVAGNSSEPQNMVNDDLESKSSLVKTNKIMLNEFYAINDINILVSDPELIDPGFFSSKYYLFTVSTQPGNWVVKRKTEEFLWIREVLVSSYPGVFIPGINKTNKSKPEENYLYKKLCYFNGFLNNVVSNPVLRTCSYLVLFLKDKDLKSVMKKYKKKDKVKDISCINTVEGEVQCLLEENIQEYESINLYLVKTEKVLMELLEKFKILISDEIRLSESIKNYSLILKEAHEANEKISNAIACNIYSDVYDSLMSWAEIIKNNTKRIYQDLKIPFKIFRMELGTFKDLLKERDALFNAYKNSAGKSNFNSIKDLYGYYNFSCISQAKKVISDIINQLKIKLVQGFKKKSEDSIKFHLIWGNLMANLTKVIE